MNSFNKHKTTKKQKKRKKKEIIRRVKLVRDVVFILGAPVVATLAWGFHKEQLANKDQTIELLKLKIEDTDRENELLDLLQAEKMYYQRIVKELRDSVSTVKFNEALNNGELDSKMFNYYDSIIQTRFPDDVIRNLVAEWYVKATRIISEITPETGWDPKEIEAEKNEFIKNSLKQKFK